ncbi:MAG: type III secretion system export apparatus subunit SctR [Methylacidiphilaceae bacterium]|nr:type III secretion system export apparatus subunit SctR [Candidatus Methylacidiphilaceae bacterium]
MTLPDPFGLILLLFGLSLAPFVAIMVTSFLKLVVVLQLLKNALGLPQIPPNSVTNGLALILSFYIMMPVIQQTGNILEAEKVEQGGWKGEQARALFTKAQGPIQAFLRRHSREKERDFFVTTARKIWGSGPSAALRSDDLSILVPAFTVSELTAAFQIGFLLYLPFLIIDLVVSNVLLAMGMMMVAPVTVALPFKLLLFVLADGWTRLIHGLVLTYQ